MNHDQQDWIPYGAAVITGFVVCMVITLATGRKEAWDTVVYFAAGIPIMCVVACALGYFFPENAWRWGVSMALGQLIAIVVGGGSLSLWPIAIVAMIVVSLPQLAVAIVAGGIALRKNAAEE
jgi:hypothetical protein